MAQQVYSPTYLTTLSGNSGIAGMYNSVGSVLTTTTWVANLGIFVPLFLPAPYPLARFCVFASSGAGIHYDLGVYSAVDGSKIVSTGSFAAPGAITVQYQDVADMTIPAGRVYLAFSSDSAIANTVGGAGGSVSVPPMRMAGIVEQASAFPLPATMTPSPISHALYPYFGITSTAS